MHTLGLRVITTDQEQNTAVAITNFMLDHIQSTGSALNYVSELAPYWKNPGQGEINFEILSDLPAEKFRQLIADTWQSECADTRWSQIYCPNTEFIWLHDWSGT